MPSLIIFSIVATDYSQQQSERTKLFVNKLRRTSQLVLRLQSATLAGVFVGDLLELAHIESDTEREAWLQDIYEDLAESNKERFLSEDAASVLSEEDQGLLVGLLDYFGITWEELVDKESQSQIHPDSGSDDRSKMLSQHRNSIPNPVSDPEPVC